jgi:hypothetical protein
MLSRELPAVDHRAADLAIVLRRYGVIADAAVNAVTVIADLDAASRIPQLSARQERPGEFLYDVRRFRLLRRRQYRALLDHLSFAGPHLTPIWTTSSGRVVIGWLEHEGRRTLLVGLNVVEELVRYTQGDPQKVFTAVDKTLWGTGHERTAYLFEDHIVAGSEMVPWADRLGFLIARAISSVTNMPLAAPLPSGARAAVLLTGDDDQAELEKYRTQLRLLDGFPITYLLLPHTRHTPETLAELPSSVELGVHVDALDRPEDYDRICAAQTAAVRSLTGRVPRTIRNHGHLNQGYWTQLRAWEENGLLLDFHIRGLDGTCPTGSYLPYRTRRPDQSWSRHWSVFSTFSDSMLFLQKWPQSKQIKVIEALGAQLESTTPGIIVANFHPQNVDHIPDVHRALIRLGRRRGWTALGGDTFAQWLAAVDEVSMSATPDGVRLHSPHQVAELALMWPGRDAAEVVPAFRGDVEVRRPS